MNVGIVSLSKSTGYNINMDDISSNPNILGGTPVFAGTRVPVESLFDCLKHGRTVDYFLEQFPTVERSQVERVLDEAKAKTLPQPAQA
jgi:uncharacterized protein (DUF433 family)